MVTVRVPILYNGEWTQENGEYRFTGTQIRGIKVPHSTTLEQFVEKVAEVISIDLSEFVISMKFKFKTSSEPLPPMEILNDCDVEFFLEEANSGFRNSLCITYERRVNIIEPNGEIRAKNSPPARHLSWEESHYYPTVDLSASQPEVDRVGIEDDSFIPHPIEVHLNVEDRMVPDIEAQNVHLDAEDMTLPNIEVRTDSPPVLTIIQPRCSNNYLPRLGLLASSNSISTNDSFLTVDNLVSNEVGDDSDGFIERQQFSSKEVLQGKLSAYAITRNFEYKTFKSGKNLLVVTCVDKNCKWRLRAVKVNNCGMFKIRKYCHVHSCSHDVSKKDHRQASAKLIAQNIQFKYDGSSSLYKAADIRHDFQQQYGYDISYHKAWRARECAMQIVRGSPEESYKLLPQYMAMLEKKNLRTRTFLEVDDTNHFKYFFMAIGSSLRGFSSSIRPVIAVDGTFLEGKYKGTMFIATCKDGNNQIYPLAFGVGDNVDVGGIFEAASKAYRLTHFTYYMNEIYKFSEAVGKYLEEAGIDKWARSHFDGRRYNIMNTNIAKCMNGILKSNRLLPIHKLMDGIIDKLREWFCKRREEAAATNSRLIKWADKVVRSRQIVSKNFRVINLNLYEFIVKDGDLDGHVNMLAKTCTCREFQLEQLPCVHAVAVCRHRDFSIYDYCFYYYSSDAWVLAYSETIYPIGP
ncbi:SWIM-type domain-containing protein [Citrus sinensis]|uniref:SWIM-type domain-containing protein n=1 Tax=Citrus sinensis TaxID=2711 RepID=A0ACB8HX80_CITSI|nr:SWIM-type domain-containing protein [Citrus sinensis]